MWQGSSRLESSFPLMAVYRQYARGKKCTEIPDAPMEPKKARPVVNPPLSKAGRQALAFKPKPLSFLPFPLLPDLPSGPLLCQETVVLTSCGKALSSEQRIFQSLKTASNFISHVRACEQLPELAMKNEVGITPNGQDVRRVRVLVSLDILTLKKNPGYDDVQQIAGCGEGRTLTEARQAARVDLAERLYRLLPYAACYLSGKKPHADAVTKETRRIATKPRKTLPPPTDSRQ